MPEAAERVAVAVRLGKVALSVRAADSSQPPEPAASDAAGPAVKPVQNTSVPLVRTIAQLTPVPAFPAAEPPAARSGTTTWGSDVSPALSQRTSGGASGASTVKVYTGAAGEKEFKF